MVNRLKLKIARVIFEKVICPSNGLVCTSPSWYGDAIAVVTTLEKESWSIDDCAHEFHVNAPELFVVNEQFFVDVLREGEIGFFKSYINGYCHIGGLDVDTSSSGTIKEAAHLMRFLTSVFHNQTEYETDKERTNLVSPLYETLKKQQIKRNKKLVSVNTVETSEEQIKYHYDDAVYDNTNEFGDVETLRSIIGKDLMYSSAISFTDIEGNSCDLDQAQTSRLDYILSNIEMIHGCGANIIEIGSGWGAFAVYAAKAYNMNVTTVTISEAQYHHCVELVKSECLEDKVTVILSDYRNLDESMHNSFDALVSIEMVEAVGEKYIPVYAEKCVSLLKENGIAIIQAITISEESTNYRSTPDFIQTMVFPGGYLPTESELDDAFVSNGVDVYNTINFGQGGYDFTLYKWLSRVAQISDKFTPERLRWWIAYLSYCIVGFETGNTDVSIRTYSKNSK